MADKVTLASIVSFQNDTTAATAYNNNNALITTAFDNTLSRDGTSPNSMSAALDMNSFPIINLPAPGSANSPARLIDVTSTNPINISLSLTGDVTAPASSGVLTTRLANMNANTIKANNTGSSAAPSDITVPQLTAMLSAPQATVFTTGSGTYNVPANTRYLIIEMVGGGGGGAGSGTTPGAGSAGGSSSVGSVAIAGGGAGASVGNGGLGGSPSAGTFQEIGGRGIDVNTTIANSPGGGGGGTFFGPGGSPGGAGAFTGNAAVSFGAGGGGAGCGTTVGAGGGGGGGAYVWHLQTAPAASYSYVVGAGGSGGTTGTSGAAGAVGVSGVIKIVAYFQ